MHRIRCLHCIEVKIHNLIAILVLGATVGVMAAIGLGALAAWLSFYAR